jgi:excinuclease ABC subunit A
VEYAARAVKKNSGSMLSHTGELLAPILAQQPRGDIEVLDPKKLAKKRSGDVDIAQVGRDTAMPWQADGRAWHTGGRVARNGKPTRWEGAALAKVVDFIEQFEGLKPANWNDQSTVEITAERKVGTGWFFHALTGDEWLVRFYFRVPKNTFDADKITRSLRMKPVDEIDEIQVYGRGERVKFNNSKGPFQEVAVDVHWLKEIDTPAFWEFVEHAVAAYLERVEVQQQKSAEDLMPWKVLGRKWHVSRKGFPSNKRVHWETAVLERLLDVVDDALKGFEVDWSNKVLINYSPLGEKTPIVSVQTKRREGVFVTILTPPGRIALGQIATLGAQREIVPHRSGQEAVKVMFDDVEQVDRQAISHLLRQAGSSH